MPEQVLPPSLQAIALEVAQLLKERNQTVSVAETAAGGLISAALLATPGASKIYAGGLTLYTLQSRTQFAGWTQANIDSYNGPTPDVVAGLAENVRGKLNSTYCVAEVSFKSAFSIDKNLARVALEWSRFFASQWVNSAQSGTAGPTASGSTPNRQPGYVALAVATEYGTKKIDLDTGKGSDREQNMLAFAINGLALLRDVVKEQSKI